MNPETSALARPWPARRELRLMMRPGTAARVGLDGAWWPWSSDPAAEFPMLVMALSSWGGPGHTMAYNLDDWQPAGPTLTTEGWTLRLAGTHTTPPNTVTFIGSTSKPIHLLVVPASTPAAAARMALQTVSSAGTSAAIEQLLADSRISRDAGPEAELCR